MTIFRRLPVLFALAVSLSAFLLFCSANAGVSYLDPAGGWRYSYDGASDTFGVSFSDALDGTWSHNQGDKWDGTGPGDALSNPGDPVGTPSTASGGPAGTSPGGAAALTDGSTTYLRVQDAGNPETHGWCQNEGPCFGVGEPTNTNRRVFFGHSMNQASDGGSLADPLVLSSTGVTISFRARIPNSGPLDPLIWLEGGNDADFNRNLVVDGPDFLNWQRGFGKVATFPNPDPAIEEGNANFDASVNSADFAIWEDQFGEGTPNTKGWFEGAPNGHGNVLTNQRGMINVAQSEPDTPGVDDIDSMVSFSLVTSADVTDACAAAPSGTICQATGGGLVMNNLNGSFNPVSNLNPVIDNVTAGGGQLNMLGISDANLNDWNEFWITMQNNGPTDGNIEVKVYMNGSTTPAGTFQVTLAGFGESVYAKEDQPTLEFGISDNGGFGSLDLDFFSYKIGVITPVAALAASAGTVPEPTGFALMTLGLLGALGTRRRFR